MKNRLLAKIPAAELDRLRPHLKQTDLPFMTVIQELDVPIEDVFFITDGVASMVNEPESGDVVEVVTIGMEGMTGFPVLLGASSMPSRTYMQAPGAGLRLRAAELMKALPETPMLHSLLLRYVMAIMNHMSQSISCNRLHEVQERCARWLLHTHDRVGGDTFMLTQDFLSQMLGVHRPSASVAAATYSGRA
jgi:CRP-like cAMP-binding protein